MLVTALALGALISAAPFRPLPATVPASQAVTQVDLESPVEADFWFAAAFAPQGDVAYLGHYQPGVITRFELPGPTPNGRITGSVEYGTLGGPIALSSDGSTIFAIDAVTGDLSAIDAATMIRTGFAPGVLPSAGWLGINAAGTSVVAASGLGSPASKLVVVDVASLSVAYDIDLPGPLQFYPASLQQPLFFADDDRTIVGVAGSFGAQSVVAYDTSTGALSGSALLGGSGGTARELTLSGDRSTAIVGYTAGGGFPTATRWSKFSAATLTSLGDFSFGASVSGAAGLILNGDGTRATATLDGVVTDFPVTGATFDPQDPSVLRFGGANALGFLWMSSRDRLALIASATPGPPSMLVYDAAGSLLGEVEGVGFGGLGGSPFRLGAGNTILFSEVFSADRVRSADLTAPSGPYVLTESLNTGAGPEFDGPYSFATSPNSAVVAVAAFGSDRLKSIDARSGAVLADVLTASGPSALTARSDGQLVLGHADGTLLVLNPQTGAETARLPLGQRVEEIVAEPSGTRVFVRLAAEPLGLGARVLQVESAASGPSILATIPVSGSVSFFTGAPLRLGNRSMWFDWDQRVAFVVSGTAGTLESIDLSSLIVTSTVSIPSAANETSIVATSDASRVFVGVGGGNVKAFDTGGGLTEVWQAGCLGSFEFRRLALAGDDSALFVDLAGGTPMFPCAGMTAYSAATGAFLDAIPVGTSGIGGDASGDDLLVWLSATQELALSRFSGGSFGALEAAPVGRPLISAPRLLADEGLALVLTTSNPLMNEPDGLAIVDLLAGQVVDACAGGAPNATGVQATLAAGGSPFAGGELVLRATGLQPGSMFGMLIVGSQLVPPMPAGNGLGLLCVGGSVGRLTSQVQTADASGSHVYRLDTQSIGTSIGTLTVQPGETWAFQDWHRDSAPQGGATSNTSTAVSVTFF